MVAQDAFLEDQRVVVGRRAGVAPVTVERQPNIGGRGGKRVEDVGRGAQGQIGHRGLRAGRGKFCLNVRGTAGGLIRLIGVAVALDGFGPGKGAGAGRLGKGMGATKDGQKLRVLRGHKAGAGAVGPLTGLEARRRLSHRAKGRACHDRVQLRLVKGSLIGKAGLKRKDRGRDLPPGRPSFITRVLAVDSGRFRVGQARRARCHQIAQALGARRPGSGCPVRNAA